MTKWTDQIDYEDFMPIRAADWNAIVRDDSKHLNELYAFHCTFNNPGGGVVTIANAQQTIAADFTGSHVAVDAGTFLLRYTPPSTGVMEQSAPIRWNATATELQQNLLTITSLTHHTGPNAILRSDVTVTGSSINTGYTLVIPSNLAGNIAEFEIIDVDLSSGGEDFDGDLTVTVDVASDSYGIIPTIQTGAQGFSSPAGALPPSNIGLFYPGYWWIHAQVHFNVATASEEMLQFRIDGTVMATAHVLPGRSGGPNYVTDLVWQGDIPEESEVGFYAYATSTPTLWIDQEYTYFEGYLIGETTS